MLLFPLKFYVLLKMRHISIAYKRENSVHISHGGYSMALLCLLSETEDYHPQGQNTAPKDVSFCYMMGVGLEDNSPYKNG